MRVVLLVLFMLAQAPSAADSQQLPYTRRVFSFTPQFLKSAKTTAAPGAPAAASGSVLFAFWTSEGGAVVSERGIEAPAELQRAAIDAIYQWKFNPSITAEGQFVQMGSAAVVDFSKSPPAISNKPMTVALASPGSGSNVLLDWWVTTLLPWMFAASNWRQSRTIPGAHRWTALRLSINTAWS